MSAGPAERISEVHLLSQSRLLARYAVAAALLHNAHLWLQWRGVVARPGVRRVARLWNGLVQVRLNDLDLHFCLSQVLVIAHAAP